MTDILVDNAIVESDRVRDAEPAFSGVLSFMRRRYTKDASGADVAVIGIPFDGATSNRPGARFGPRSIREASAGFDCEPQYPSMRDPFSVLKVVDVGDCFIDFSRQHAVQPMIAETVGALLRRCGHVVSLGGDHSITLPILRAYGAQRGPIAVVHFDAHPDAWYDKPDRVSHGTWMRQAVAEKLVRAERSIQVGVRTFVPEGIDVKVVYAYDALELPPVELAARIRSTVGDAPVYLSFDIDALDPAYAPGTGCPVAGGLSSAFALRTLWHLRDLSWCGMDVVEVCPPFDPAGVTGVVAATLVQHYLQIIAEQKAARAR